MPRRRRLGPLVTVTVTVAIAAVAPGTASAGAGPLALTQCAAVEGVWQCTGLVRTWDGVPLDTTVTLPAAGASGLPLVVELNGFGNSRFEYLNPHDTAYTDNAYAWARDGYAVLTYTARGLWGSCGTPDARLADAAGCARGWIHLADARYEVRDAQELAGRLVDEGVARADAIGVTGDSYGGGQTLMAAALNDRTMLPDGRLVPWRTAAGRRLRLAAAAPVIPWSDLVTAAAPNGRVSPYGVTSRVRATSPVGVVKETFVNAIFAAAQFATGPGQPLGQPFIPGRPMGFLAPPGIDPQSDVAGWVLRTDRGEPYDDASADAVVRLLTRFHSAVYLDDSHAPPPLFIASGFTDDLFPVDEALRYAAKVRRDHPRVPVSLLFGDFGHQRAANKPAERKALVRAIHGWFDRWLRGRRGGPRRGVTAYVETCPRSAPSLGPVHARTFAGLANGALNYASTAPRTIGSGSGDLLTGIAIDPATGGGDSCVARPATTAPGTARYTLRPAGKSAFTLLGAPHLRARITLSGAASGVAQLAARLWDVAPDGTQQLVARGSSRPHDGLNRWWMHPAAWRFAPHHAAVLELLGADLPYGRPSNGVYDVRVRDLRVTLPRAADLGG